MKKILSILTIIMMVIASSVYAADVKVSALPSATAVTSDDLIMIVDSPGGTPVSKKITIANLFSGLGNIVQSGSPANHYWAYFTADKTITGVAITASKPVCSDANGNPAVCAGTEGVWQPVNASLTALSGLSSPITVDGNNIAVPGALITKAADGSRKLAVLANTVGVDATANSFELYPDSDDLWKINQHGTEYTFVLNGLATGGLLFGDSSPDAAGKIGYDGDLKWYDTALRVAVAVDKTQTLTNKTFDANGTGNVLKGYSYIQIPGSAYKLYGSSVTAPSTTATAWLYNLPKFSNSADKANNYVDFMFTVPPDIDTAVDLTATLSIQLGGADTGDHAYILSMCNPAGSAAAECTPGTPIALSFTADGSGASGDIEYTAETTLTDWKSNVTAGRMIRVRLERDGDDETNDASTVDSYPLMLNIKYGYTN